MNTIKGLVLALTLAATAGSANAQDDSRRYAGQVRVICEVGQAGMLRDCTVTSQFPAGTAFDEMGLRAASQSVAIGPDGEVGQGRIHFPIRMMTEAVYEEGRRGPLPPILIEPPSMTPVRIPWPPSDETIKPWGGLNCVFRPDGSLRRCWPDIRTAPEGVLAGAVRRVAFPDSVSDRIHSLPTELPAPPSEVLTDWRFHGRNFAGEGEYSLDYEPPTAASRLVWSARARPSSNQMYMDYTLEEYDCAGGRVRDLLWAIGVQDRLKIWDITEPQDWTERSRLRGIFADKYDTLCAA